MFKRALPNQSCIACFSRPLNPTASFVLGNTSLGTSLSRNSQSGPHPSSTLHSNNLCSGTSPRTIAQCSRYTHFPFRLIPESNVPSKHLNKPAHISRSYTCHPQKYSRVHHDKAQKSQVSFTWQRFFTALACHASRSRRTLRMTFASGYAWIISAANTEPAASVTAALWPISASNSLAVM